MKSRGNKQSRQPQKTHSQEHGRSFLCLVSDFVDEKFFDSIVTPERPRLLCLRNTHRHISRALLAGIVDSLLHLHKILNWRRYRMILYVLCSRRGKGQRAPQKDPRKERKGKGTMGFVKIQRKARQGQICYKTFF